MTLSSILDCPQTVPTWPRCRLFKIPNRQTSMSWSRVKPPVLVVASQLMYREAWLCSVYNIDTLCWQCCLCQLQLSQLEFCKLHPKAQLRERLQAQGASHVLRSIPDCFLQCTGHANSGLARWQMHCTWKCWNFKGAWLIAAHKLSNDEQFKPDSNFGQDKVDHIQNVGFSIPKPQILHLNHESSCCPY